MSWALKPHPLTSEPTKAWKKFQMEQKCMKIRVKPPTKPPDEDKVLCPISFKVVIAGNHELSFDPKMAGIVPRGGKSAALSPSFPALGNPQEELLEAIESPSNEAKRLLTNCFYLEDQGIELFGLKIYGTPW
ncbi:unnamed protein product [Cyprideis torosa]|uniref:Uncharacterized protein n=1 Tax=Cyprideis torosa TaxID=163714 RepID=A0A7R8WM32_9CRUS|nr:unnamed protein product [Cyprideis torosa]CAG0904911.1 unnamed protein product [Cyprideis torosa]